MATHGDMKLRSWAWGACALGLSLVGCEDDGGSGLGDAGRADGGALGDAGGAPDEGGRDAAGELDGEALADAAQGDSATQDGAADDGGAPDGAPSRWYEQTSPLSLSLSGAFSDAFLLAHAGTPDGIIPPVRLKDPFAGTGSYENNDGSQRVSPVELAVRGNSSLQECAFPKLKLTFPGRSELPNEVFFDTKKVKVGTHCGEEDTVNGTIGRFRNQLATWREEVVYQLARTLGITIMQTRPATIAYTDTSAQPGFDSPLTRKAFLLEHVDELARRLGAVALDDPTNCGDDPNPRPDYQAVLRVKLFHALIGNWDWELGPRATDGCGDLWNTEVLVHPNGTLTLVPTDFDLSAFVIGRVRNPQNNLLEVVSRDNAQASARHYLSEAVQGEPKGALDALKAEFLGKQAQLLSLIDASLMDEEGKRAGKLLVQGFMTVLAE